jgi:hypothetical protein
MVAGSLLDFDRRAAENMSDMDRARVLIGVATGLAGLVGLWLLGVAASGLVWP